MLRSTSALGRSSGSFLCPILILMLTGVSELGDVLARRSSTPIGAALTALWLSTLASSKTGSVHQLMTIIFLDFLKLMAAKFPRM